MASTKSRPALLASASLVTLTLAVPMHATGAQAQNAPEAGSLDEITVTATREEERAIDTLAGVSITTRQEIRRDQPQRIGTMLTRVPGVTTQENPNDPATSINIRGLQDFGRVAVTIDGARQNFQRSGHNANGAFFLDPVFVRAIDITRGPVANVYGSGAIGGVVSFETLDPSDILKPGERLAGEIGATGIFGRQSGWNGSAIGAGRIADGVAEGLLGLSFRSLNPYRDGAGFRIVDTDQDLLSGLGKIVLNPAEGHEIKLGGQYQTFDFANGAGTATTPRRDNEVTTSNVFLRYSFSRPDNPSLNLKASVYQTTTDTDQVRVSGTAAQIGQSRYFKIRTTGFDINNTSRFDLGPVNLSLTYGGDWFEDRVRTNDVAGNGDETTPSGQRRVGGGFAQAHVRWSIVDVIGALRYDHYELESATQSASGDRVSPKLTVGITPLAGFQLYATYAEGYRAPSTTETLVEGLHPAPATFRFFPNPNLRPEVGRTYEAGVNLKYDDVFRTGDALRGKFSAFRNDVDDYIDSVFTDAGAPCGAPIPGACADAFFRYANIAEARLTGVEGEVHYDARAWFVSLSGSSVRGDNLITNQPLQSVYPDKISLGGGMRFLNDRLTVGGRVTLTDAQKRVPTGVPTSKGYTLVDLNASYEIAADARAFVSLENIGDVRYRRFRDGDDSPGFVGKIGFSTRFGS